MASVSLKIWNAASEAERATFLKFGMTPPKAAVAPLDRLAPLDGVGQSTTFPCRADRLLDLYRKGLIVARKGGAGNEAKVKIGAHNFGGDTVAVPDGDGFAVKNMGIARIASAAALFVQSDDVWPLFCEYLEKFQTTEDSE